MTIMNRRTLVAGLMASAAVPMSMGRAEATALAAMLPAVLKAIEVVANFMTIVEGVKWLVGEFFPDQGDLRKQGGGSLVAPVRELASRQRGALKTLAEFSGRAPGQAGLDRIQGRLETLLDLMKDYERSPLSRSGELGGYVGQAKSLRADCIALGPAAVGAAMYAVAIETKIIEAIILKVPQAHRGESENIRNNIFGAARLVTEWRTETEKVTLPNLLPDESSWDDICNVAASLGIDEANCARAVVDKRVDTHIPILRMRDKVSGATFRKQFQAAEQKIESWNNNFDPRTGLWIIQGQHATPLTPSDGSTYSVFFSPGVRSISDGERATLDAAAARWRELQAERPTRVLLSAYADRREAAGYADNGVGLARQRAASVRDALVGRGVPQTSISTRAFGAGGYMDGDIHEADVPQNRRVQIEFEDAY